MTERRVPYSYLAAQFKNPEKLFGAIKRVVERGDFTLGQEVAILEKKAASICNTKFAVGVNSGTDALFLILKALNIGLGDEVITAPNSFLATTGAIVQTGGVPIYVDVLDTYMMNPALIEDKITPRTKAIMPVHLTGCPADMDPILEIARKHNLFVIEDAAQAIGAKYKAKPVGSMGIAAGFSFHPLKNINGWGDGGMITTNSEELYEKLKLLRNHGLKDRDHCVFFAYNARLDTIQAAIILELIDHLPTITEKRISLAKIYDQALSTIGPDVRVPPRSSEIRQVFHTYVIQVTSREELMKYLLDHGIETKIHYPMPIHLQEAAKKYGYHLGDFPVCEKQAAQIITLPLNQHLTEEDVFTVCDRVRSFYHKHQ